nr:Efflux pump membrane transporter BepE [Chlamydiota bacterium]
SRFFIDHPIFACVIAIILTLAGLTAMRILPVEQYPNITPPLIQVTTNYNGANAKTIANDVASPLEQQILGAEKMIYMYSQNSSTGYMTLSVYFDIDSNANMDQVNVQNLVNQAQSKLPFEEQKEGIIIKKQTPNILLLIALQSPDGLYDEVFTSNFATINIVNELDLIPGISNISVIGARDYSMRIWLRPDRMAQLGITANDVINAIEEQNHDFGVGQLGQAPNYKPTQLTIPMSTKGRLETPTEFENIVLRANLDGAMVRIKDVAKVTLGAQDYSVNTSVDNIPTTMIAIYQQYGANALDVANSVKAAMKKISKNFPKGLEYSIPYDTTRYINTSIDEVIHTIFAASILVVLVVFIFLQSLRATLIPLLALLVSIIATFTGLYMLGYTINTLTLFGMVLAIGIVVDDAIVVVENVDRNMHTLNLPPKEAAKKAMKEVTVPILAIVFVLCAVFLPVALLGGIAGKLYRQFAVTLSISVIFSGLIALSLSPAIAALVLRPKKKEGRLARGFNTALSKLTQGYLHVTKMLIIHRWVGMTLFAGVIAAVFVFFHITPTSFVPQEDQGYLITFANMPDGASLARTTKIDAQIQKIALDTPGVDHVISLSGYSIIESLEITTIGTNFIILKNWDERKKWYSMRGASFRVEGESETSEPEPVSSRRLAPDPIWEEKCLDPFFL